MFDVRMVILLLPDVQHPPSCNFIAGTTMIIINQKNNMTMFLCGCCQHEFDDTDEEEVYDVHDIIEYGECTKCMEKSNK